MNRNLLITLLGACTLAAACKGPEASLPVTYANPVLHLDYSDPDVCRVGEDFYMTASSFNCFPGLPILHSKDLVHWEEIGAALTDYDEAFHTSVQHGNGVWAPSIRYHDGWYYIYVGDPDRGIFMVRTQDPSGRWEPPVWVVRARGFIDPCPLWDEDGRAYLSHALAGSRAGLKSVVLVAPMQADGTSLTDPSRIVYDGHLTQPTIEGTKFYKRNGYYYIFAPAGGVSTGWQTVLRSRSPFGPFEEKVVMASAPGTINGPHQGAWVDAPDGSEWFLHFQDKGAYGRIVHLQPLSWRSDDWPLIGEDPDGDGIGQPVSDYIINIPRHPSPREGIGLFYYPRGERGVAKIQSDLCAGNGRNALSPEGIGLYFSPPDERASARSGSLGTWQYPAVPEAKWQMELPDGGLRLYSVEQESRSLWECRNVVQRKFPAERFTVQAKLQFHPNPQLRERGETAGFVVMGDDYAGLFVEDRADGLMLTYRVCEKAGKGGEEQVMPLEALSSGTFWVKLEVRPRATETPVPDAVCRFCWSRDGKRWEKVPQSFTARPEMWIGAKFGFFCNRYARKNDSGWLDVTDLRVKPEYAPLEGFVYDEADVPSYTLPDALTFENGRKVKTVKQWEKRRKELLSLFEEEMYGTAPGRPVDERFEVVSEDAAALGGKALRREVKVHLGGGEYLTLLLYEPVGSKKPLKTFLGVNFFGNHTICEDPGIGLPDTLRYRSSFTLDARGSQAHRWPLDTILSRGYAVATFCCEDISPDSEWECDKRVKRLYPGYTWGSLAAWAWGLSRAMDYLETCPEVGPVAVFGHSRMGKAALWAAAKDRRFAMYISDASGCGGAAISRRRYGETLRRINTHFPHWFTGRFHFYSGNEDLLPFDQHEALALIAPRPLYLESASEDRWSDPHGEFLGLCGAAPVYRLYGLDILTEEEEPAVEQPVSRGPSGYHIREGKHQILLYDWLQFLDFADKNL